MRWARQREGSTKKVMVRKRNKAKEEERHNRAYSGLSVSGLGSFLDLQGVTRAR